MEEHDDLFDQHARFRADGEVPEGWYRAGQALDEGVWAVDLDLFVDVTLPATEWEAVKGAGLHLSVHDQALTVEVPADASLEECWTLPGCGLFEAAPGVTEEQLAEAEAEGLLGDVGRFGDMHIIPIVAEN